jgi:hypothetical protein
VEVLNILRKKYFILLLPLLTLLVLSPNLKNIGIIAFVDQNQEGDSTEKIVLFHQGKNQFFNSSNMAGALEALETNNYTVTLSSEPINRTSLTGIDVLIIAGSPTAPPGMIDNYRYDDQEVGYIEEWLLQPKHGLVLLSNPYSSNSSLNVDNSYLNRLITLTDLFPESRFTTGSDNQGLSLQTLFPDKYDDPTTISVNVTKTNIFDLENNMTLVTKSNSLETLHPMAEAGLNVFGISAQGTFDLQAQHPTVMGGSTSESTTSRLFLMGSAISFSDLKGPELSNISWLETADNKDIWVESIKWTSQTIEVIPETNTDEIMLLLVLSTIIIGIVFILSGFIFFMRNQTLVLERSTGVAGSATQKQEIVRDQPSEGKEGKKKPKQPIKSSRRKQKRKK